MDGQYPSAWELRGAVRKSSSGHLGGQGNVGNWELPSGPVPNSAQSSSARQDIEKYGFSGLLF